MNCRLFSNSPNSYFDIFKMNENEKEAAGSEKKAPSRVWSRSPYSMQASFRRKEPVTDGSYDDE